MQRNANRAHPPVRGATTRLAGISASVCILLVFVLGSMVARPPVRSYADDPTPTAEPPLAGHALGPADAYLTIIMYGDFQCALCARYARDLETIRARHPVQVRLVWRHLPDLDAHANSALALQASEAAAAQGHFWDMHAQLFTHQAEWTDLTPDAFRAALDDYSAVIGLDRDRFNADLDAGTYVPVIAAAQRDAHTLGITGAPVLLFNGIPYTGRDDRFGLEETARLVLLSQRQFDRAPEMHIDPQKSYHATLVTEKGDIVITLFAQEAPVTVNNFVFLARSGWYDNMTFHYVVPGFIAQTGDPSDTGRGSPGYTIPDEHPVDTHFDRAGLVAMAHPTGIANSAGSQFFFTLAPLEPVATWDDHYTIFGAVLAGMDVLHSLTPRNANDPVNFPAPPPGDHVITITIEES